MRFSVWVKLHLVKAQTATDEGEPDVFTPVVPMGTTEKCALYTEDGSVAEQE